MSITLDGILGIRSNQTFILFTYGEMVNRPTVIDWVKYFKCKKCWEIKPLNKCYFHINTMFSTGFNSKCKSCVKEERESKPKVKYITRAELEEENKKLKEHNWELIENHKKDIDILCKENKKLKEELEELKENNRVKKINEYYEEYVKANTLKECIKANTLKRDFSRQRIRELEEDLHMLRVENDMLRKKLRGEY